MALYRAPLMPARVPCAMLHRGQLGFKSLGVCREHADDGEAEVLADRLELAALIEGHKNRAAVRACLIWRIPVLEALVDYSDVESKLGLDANLESIFHAHQENV